MRQLPPLADKRELEYCVYCGGRSGSSRDHVPSRVLLDEPYPDNLPVVPACTECNGAFSRDEEYVACLVECVLAGSANAAEVTREKIARILRDRPALAARIARARSAADEDRAFSIEDHRVRNVVLKLARGHAAYELHLPSTGQPTHVAFAPLSALTEASRAAFESAPTGSHWPEVGSRGMQRLAASGGPSDWIVVQPRRYRYLGAVACTGPLIRFVISEYLACEVMW